MLISECYILYVMSYPYLKNLLSRNLLFCPYLIMLMWFMFLALVNDYFIDYAFRTHASVTVK